MVAAADNLALTAAGDDLAEVDKVAHSPLLTLLLLLLSHCPSALCYNLCFGFERATLNTVAAAEAAADAAAPADNDKAAAAAALAATGTCRH